MVGAKTPNWLKANAHFAAANFLSTKPTYILAAIAKHHNAKQYYRNSRLN
jgi:putative heme iron utilization protein